MINGNGVTSLRKTDTENQKVPSVGFTKLVFAHKAVAGATGISLTALTTPPEMAVNGFVNATASQLGAAQLLFFRNNLRLISSLRGPMLDSLSYVLASSTQINFLGFTALENEVFVGMVDNAAQSGLRVVDATATPATGVLTAGSTDFNIGQSFQTNKYGTTQAGACLVWLDGALQVRNTGNSSAVLDGNYREVDNGSGSFSVIRFNDSDGVNDRNVVVTPNGLLSERPDGSMMAVIEALQGQVTNMASYVGTLAGQTPTTILGGSPTNVDLKAFGDRVLTLESNRARIDVGNAWSAAQALVGVTDGSAASTGQVGEVIPASVSTTSIGTSQQDVTGASIALTPGRWRIEYHANLRCATGATSGNTSALEILITDNANNSIANSFRELKLNTVAAVSLSLDIPASAVSFVNITASTTYKLRATRTDSAGTGTASVLSAGNSITTFFATRIG